MHSQRSNLPCRGVRLQAPSRWIGARRSAVAPASAAPVEQLYPLPRNVQEMVDGCVDAVRRAGRSRHIVELINPVNEKARNFMSTEAMDYPESNFAEFERIVGLAKNFAARLTGNDDMPLKVKRIDEGGIDGDLCCIVSSQDLSVVCMIWPTAAKLKQLKQLTEDARIGQLVVINPLWKTEGNLVSEFGIGPWRKANEEFVASFEPSYLLYEQRIGAPSSVNLARGARYESGGVVRVQRCFPGPFEVHVMAPNGASQAVGRFEMAGGKPTYQKLDALITEGRKAKLAIFDVARQASSLAIERGDAAMPSGQDVAPAGDTPASEGTWYTRDQVLDMDMGSLRRVLMGLGLPSAGTVAKLQARALAVADAVAAGGDVEQGVKQAKALR